MAAPHRLSKALGQALHLDAHLPQGLAQTLRVLYTVLHM